MKQVTKFLNKLTPSRRRTNTPTASRAPSPLLPSSTTSAGNQAAVAGQTAASTSPQLSAMPTSLMAPPASNTGSQAPLAAQTVVSTSLQPPAAQASAPLPPPGAINAGNQTAIMAPQITAGTPLPLVSANRAGDQAAVVPTVQTSNTSAQPSGPYAVSVAAANAPPGAAQTTKSTIHEGMKTILRFIHGAADAFPPLKSTAGGLLGLIGLIENTRGNKDDAALLLTKLEAVVLILDKYKDKSFKGSAGERIMQLNSDIEKQVLRIKDVQSRSKLAALANVQKDADDVNNAYRTLSGLLDVFLVETTLSVELSIGELSRTVNRHRKLSMLARLAPVQQAEYDATFVIRRRACTQRTRVQILSELLGWAVNANDKRIYWLNGMAGTGKTTIAYTFCKALKGLGQLGASFFCSRNDASCSAAEHIAPTVAFQLARYSSAVFDALSRYLEENLGDSGKNFETQFRHLLVHPLQEASSDLLQKHAVIVIDALDECANQQFVSDFLANLWAYAASVPVKIFITS